MTLRIEDVKKAIEMQQNNIGGKIRRVPGQSPVPTFGLPIENTRFFAKKANKPDTAVAETAKPKKSTKGTFQQSNKNRGAGYRMRNTVKSQYNCRKVCL